MDRVNGASRAGLATREAENNRNKRKRKIGFIGRERCFAGKSVCGGTRQRRVCGCLVTQFNS
jgi:hypothetical protein